MIPDQYPNYYKALEIYTEYFDPDIMILFPYPSSIVITSDYCICNMHALNLLSSLSFNNGFQYIFG